jgi:hypothetical protein
MPFGEVTATEQIFRQAKDLEEKLRSLTDLYNELKDKVGYVKQDFTASMLQLNERVTKIERVSHDHIFTENRLTYPERE